MTLAVAEALNPNKPKPTSTPKVGPLKMVNPLWNQHLEVPHLNTVWIGYI